MAWKNRTRLWSQASNAMCRRHARSFISQCGVTNGPEREIFVFDMLEWIAPSSINSSVVSYRGAWNKWRNSLWPCQSQIRKLLYAENIYLLSSGDLEQIRSFILIWTVLLFGESCRELQCHFDYVNMELQGQCHPYFEMTVNQIFIYCMG